ncbi:FAD-binding oxidoreductase [Defluviimonas sp. WL0002]|uniref:FAD-binding oxidoreductase n=1 Tax=Albidovulum marisflavi TaxID=2984159 RepID=A0ABT2ZH99_9RHOB|nr:FAD-binding oxidoreductase [Defluviimonas sp. WL0002]MCV2870499.1 FAD-binding oxidoreductase [Defluviimonas sp. WL0002]
MRRLYEAPAYDPSWPRSHWRASHPAPLDLPPLDGETKADIAVIGSGFAGLNAALEAAASGANVIVLEAVQPGWGASGRNGGFCGYGGTKLSDKAIVSRVGLEGARDFRDFQCAAIAHVGQLIDANGWNARQGPDGEAVLAQSPRVWAGFAAEAQDLHDLYGERVDLIPPQALRERGMAGPGFHGALMLDQGFPVDPMAYVEGLARLAIAKGVRICGNTHVTGMTQADRGWRLTTAAGAVLARKILVATNGYSSDNLPNWIGGRNLPAFSAVLVTRPLTEAERQDQGYTDPHMAFDARKLLHYFRHLPDGRFLFGMRGGTSGTAEAHERMKIAVRAHFEALFPAWAAAETEHSWSGFVCLTGSLAPFVGEVPGASGLYAAFGWHGSGVAAASYSGQQVGRLMTGRTAHLPALVRVVPRRFPLPAFRRLWLRLAYAGYGLTDGALPRPER